MAALSSPKRGQMRWVRGEFQRQFHCEYILLRAKRPDQKSPVCRHPLSMQPFCRMLYVLLYPPLPYVHCADDRNAWVSERRDVSAARLRCAYLLQESNQLLLKRG